MHGEVERIAPRNEPVMLLGLRSADVTRSFLSLDCSFEGPPVLTEASPLA